MGKLIALVAVIAALLVLMIAWGKADDCGSTCSGGTVQVVSP
jgi:hypothetical protein